MFRDIWLNQHVSRKIIAAVACVYGLQGGVCFFVARGLTPLQLLAWCGERRPCFVLFCLPPSAVACASEHERQLKYTKWRTYQCSHLLENIKHEFLDAESRVEDHYFLEKVRYLSARLKLPQCTEAHL